MAAKPAPRKQTRLTGAARDRRNNMIIDLYLAGWTQRDIAARVNLAASRVNHIIGDELRAANRDQLLGNENAMIIYTARLERLVRAAFDKAIMGDLKAVEVARRLLREQADLYGLADAALPVPPMSDTELDSGEPADELSEYRRRRA